MARRGSEIDSVFEVDGGTLAEWGHEAKLRFSHRTRAIQLGRCPWRVKGLTDERSGSLSRNENVIGEVVEA